MTMGSNGTISDDDKVRIASGFLLQSPPGEFNEVFNNTRILVNNDALLERGCVEAAARYNKDQFVQVKLDGVDQHTLITAHNELPDGRFYDPKSKRAFRYDHLRKEASDVQPIDSTTSGATSAGLPPIIFNEQFDQFRRLLQQGMDEYVADHFHRTGGVATVFVAGPDTGSGGSSQTSSAPSFVICLESHQFQPRNYWNARWRSEWHVPVPPSLLEASSTSSTGGGPPVMTGKFRVHIHYYEDGNVQMISEKSCNAELLSFVLPQGAKTDRATLAKEVITKIREAESNYHASIQESNALMSESTFKALRRQLPVTRSKLDWIKLHSYRVTQDMKPQ